MKDKNPSAAAKPVAVDAGRKGGGGGGGNAVPTPPASTASSVAPETLFEKINSNSATKEDARAVLSQLTPAYLEGLKGSSLGTAYAAQLLAFAQLGREAEACTAGKRAAAAGTTSKTKTIVDATIASCQ